MKMPSGGLGVTSGEYLMHQSASRMSAASSSSGVASMTVRSGMSDCACVTVMPQREIELRRRLIDARDHAALPLHHGRHERLIPWRRVFASLAAADRSANAAGKAR